VPPRLAFGFWVRTRTSSPFDVKIRTVDWAGSLMKWTRFCPGPGSHSADPRNGLGTTATRSRFEVGGPEGWTVTISLESMRLPGPRIPSSCRNRSRGRRAGS